jgi:hypothetical protein
VIIKLEICLACVDTAAIIHNGKVIADKEHHHNLIKNIDAKNVLFWRFF